jgi:glutamyl-tRNA reductase
MFNGFKILTLTHHHTSLRDIEKYVIEREMIGDKLSAIKQDLDIHEIMYLATCNRVLFFIYDDQNYSEDRIQAFFSHVNSELTDSDFEVLKNQICFYQGQEAIKHLFELASSINSMVIGEREIFRQLREAYDHSRSIATSGDNIRLAMRFTVEAAKCVYANTAIGEKALSVVALAFRQMMMLTQNREARIVLVGAGSTNTLFAKFLKKHNFLDVNVFNRTLSTAEKLADSFSGKAYQLDDLTTFKSGFDILIVCTGSVKSIITPELYADLLGQEVDKKIIVDLSVPNNVDKRIADIFDVHLIEVDALKEQAQENLQHRIQAIESVKLILKDFMDQFTIAFKQRQIEKSLKNVPTEIRNIKDKAINQVFAKEIETLDDTTKELIFRMLNYMEKGCIGIPMKAARESII